MAVTERKSDAELSESLRHDADAGPVVTPNYTILRRAEWEHIVDLFRRAAGDERAGDERVEALITGAGGVGKTLLKIATLPEERIAEIDDFVDFLRQREEQHALRRDFAALSEPSFANVWDNPEDSIYDEL